mgnify:CR=1 FL=1
MKKTSTTTITILPASQLGQLFNHPHNSINKMPKYTIEELYQLKPEEVQPVNFDAVEFKALIEKVKQLQALREEEYNNGHGHFGRRRSSHHHTRPKVNKHKPKVVVDDEGWATFETKTATEEGQEGSNDEGSAIEYTHGENKKTRSSDSLVQETVRVRPNNKNISSSRPADNRDIIMDKKINGFNAFAALGSDDEDEDEDDE